MGGPQFRVLEFLPPNAIRRRQTALSFSISIERTLPKESACLRALA